MEAYFSWVIRLAIPLFGLEGGELRWGNFRFLYILLYAFVFFHFVIFFKMLQKVYLSFVLCKILFLKVVEVRLFPEGPPSQPRVEKLEVVFNTEVIAVVSHRDQHHVGEGPTEASCEDERVGPGIDILGEFVRVDQVSILLDYLKRLLVALLKLSLLIENHCLQGLITDESYISDAPMDREIRVSGYLKIGVPKRFLAEGHLVSHEENKHDMLTVMPVLEIFDMVVIDFTDPRPLKLFLIDRDLARYINVRFHKPDISLGPYADQLTLLAVSYGPLDTWTNDSIFFGPVIEPDILFLLLDPPGDLPIDL